MSDLTKFNFVGENLFLEPIEMDGGCFPAIIARDYSLGFYLNVQAVDVFNLIGRIREKGIVNLPLWDAIPEDKLKELQEQAEEDAMFENEGMRRAEFISGMLFQGCNEYEAERAWEESESERKWIQKQEQELYNETVILSQFDKKDY